MFRRFLVLAVLLVPIVCLFGCFGQTKRGDQEVTLPTKQEPPNLDPSKSTDTESAKVLNNVQEGLYRSGEKDEPVLGIASEEPTISADKTVYTFKLKDTKWSDGKPLTAHDFVYGWLRTLDKKTVSEYANMLYDIKNAEAFNRGKASSDSVGVKALDDKTLEVTLEKPLASFKDLLTFTTFLPQRKDIVEKYGSKYAQEADTMVYSGPFELKSWKHNEKLQLKKNDNYWDAKTVRLKVVNMMIVKDNQTSLNLYNTNKLDYTPLESEFVEKYNDSPEKVVLNEAAVSYLGMNQRNKLFTNKKIRKAISLAVNRNVLCDSVLKNGSVPAAGIVPPTINAGDKKYRDMVKTELEFNPQEAKRLWNEGLVELGMQNPEKIDLLGVNDGFTKKILENIQFQLNHNLGAHFQISSVGFKTRLDREKKGTHDVVVSGWMGDYNDPMTFMNIFKSMDSFNYSKWQNKQYDQLVTEAKHMPDPVKRTLTISKAERILVNEDYGIAPLFFRGRTGLQKQEVKGILYHSVGPEYDLKWAYVETKK